MKAYRKGIKEWDSETLSVWMGTIGFDQCKRIVKFGRISGEKMANASSEWMQETLGIDDKKCHRLRAEVEKVRNECMQDCALFGWGNNKHGQLATKNSIVPAPKKINLPETITIDETNKDSSIKTKNSIFIQKIFCGNRYSGILLSNGEFWACGNCPEAGKAVLTNIIEGIDTNSDEESKGEEDLQKNKKFSKTKTAQQADSNDEDEGEGNRKKGNKK